MALFHPSLLGISIMVAEIKMSNIFWAQCGSIGLAYPD